MITRQREKEFVFLCAALWCGKDSLLTVACDVIPFVYTGYKTQEAIRRKAEQLLSKPEIRKELKIS